MSKRRILFVDSDERVLDGLEGILWPLEDEWDMRFVSSGMEALAAVAAEDFDLVVSEIRMAGGMDGITLFDELREHHPSVVRVILSGYTEQMDTLRSTGVAHQFVAKPCPADQLKETVDRASALRRDLSNPRLLAAITRTKALPTPPRLYNELKRELFSNDASLARVAAIVAKDPAMAAKIIQIVNSAFFGLRRRVVDIAQAVALLGIDTIMGLVLTTYLFQESQLPRHQQAALDQVLARSFAVAQTAKALAMTEGYPQLAEGAFLAGLLHDCGFLVFAANWPDELMAVIGRDDARDDERARFGADHAFVGAYLLALWGLPDDVVEAVAYHHEPSLSPGRSFTALTAVHAAHALETRRDPRTDPVFDTAYLDAAGFADRIDGWLRTAEHVAYERANP